ncbi:hypothetical protein BDV28DRAFT_148992 [Aspergillus coremiiformis]|uniref:HNH nuclease domain-containing protein n=1 Tax=Aspergillus coremiiformis TaxID=138285 RepID=A0A5N6Z489_9EURO|nr:hypothetical protein BDV28DRAFT_148992 [Aspergillus coremiiformis]
MGPADELEDGGRAALIEDLSKSLHTRSEFQTNSVIWACLWLSDIESLAGMASYAKHSDEVVLSLLEDQGVNFLPLLKACKFHSWTIEYPLRCGQRDKYTCVITGVKEPVQISPIHPLPICRQEPFLKALSLFWSKKTLASWKQAIADFDSANTCSNHLCLSYTVHDYWHSSFFALKPLEISADRKQLEVQFWWLPNLEFARRVLLTTAPILPRDLDHAPIGTKFFHNDTERKIRSGDILVFRTEDPETHPLPSFELLHMQWILNRVVALGGAAGFTKDEESRGDVERDRGRPNRA